MFNITLESHKAFLDYKKHKVEKVETSGFFQRGLVHGFGKKNLKFFHVFIFLQKTASKMCLTIF